MNGPAVAIGRGGRALAVAALLLAACLAASARVASVRRLVDGMPASTAVYDARGTLLRLTLARDEKYRLVLPLDAYPRSFVEAVLLKEDRYFRVHRGINPLSTAKAAWHSLVRGDYRAGGSTITMQLARLLGDYGSSTIAGKLRQMGDALCLELACTKDEILESYLASVPCGGNVEGFGAASLAYFRKSPADLALSESLLLACLPQRPWTMGPGGVEPALIESRDRLFMMWTARHPDAAADGLEFRMPVSLRAEFPFLAPHAVDSLLRSYPGAARIDSTVDYGLQRDMERVLRSYVERKRGKGIENASALLVDADDMRILAEVGSSGFFDEAIDGQVDGTEARRSPGSALKPFLYGLALDRGVITPMSVLKDSPIHFSGYNPDNFDNDFEGPITARDALVRSRNVPAVYLMREVANPGLYDLLEAGGVGGLKGRDWYGLSIILGTAEVTMKELVALYGALANGGRWTPLAASTRELESRERRQLLSPEAAWIVLDMLKDKARPEESAAVLSPEGRPACAWKTGTSIGFRDAWAVGVFGHYILAAWVGDFRGSSNPAFVGLDAAAPLMFEIEDSMAASGIDCSPGAWAERPGKIVRAEVCAASGEAPTALCPRVTRTWFIPGVSPIKACDVHQEVFVDASTGLRRKHAVPGATNRQVMEVWPSDLMELFAKAGLPRRAPPRFAPGEDDGGDAGGEGPEIVSPLSKGKYIARGPGGGGDEMPFVANVPSDAGRVFWFLDDSFVGASARGKALFWRPEPGDHALRAVDDLGRSSLCRFSVQAGE